MLLFGGQRLPGDHFYNDVWIFNFQKAEFGGLTDEVPGCTWNKIQTQGDAPAPRRAHCAAIYHNRLIMIGGKSEIRNVNES